MTVMAQQSGGRKRRWRLWLGLLAAVALAGLVAGLHQSARDGLAGLPLQGASALLPPLPGSAATAQQQAAAASPAWLKYDVVPPPALGKPRIAVVIDGLGLDSARSARAVALKGPVTLAFLAYAGNLPQQTASARKAGHELLLHVATGGMNPAISLGPAGIPGAPPPEETLRRLRWDLDRLPAYVGVDMPASSPADPQTMQTVMGELKARGLLFLDSRAGGGNGAAARDAGVPYAAHDLLLDPAADMDAQLARLEDLARKNGTAIAVVPGTDAGIAALKSWLPTLAKKGIVLVPLSDIVKTRNN